MWFAHRLSFELHSRRRGGAASGAPHAVRERSAEGKRNRSLSSVTLICRLLSLKQPNMTLNDEFDQPQMFLQPSFESETPPSPPLPPPSKDEGKL